jgi:hypothetical protein
MVDREGVGTKVDAGEAVETPITTASMVVAAAAAVHVAEEAGAARTMTSSHAKSVANKDTEHGNTGTSTPKMVKKRR